MAPDVEGVGLSLAVRLEYWAAGLGMKSVLYEVVPFHLGILTATGLAMALVVLFATWLPSRRAARVSPMEAMRED